MVGSGRLNGPGPNANCGGGVLVVGDEPAFVATEDASAASGELGVDDTDVDRLEPCAFDGVELHPLAPITHPATATAMHRARRDPVRDRIT